MRCDANYQRIIAERVFRYRRKRKRKLRLRTSRNCCSSFDPSGIIRRFSSNFIRHLERAGYIDRTYSDCTIEVPEYFSFKYDFDGCICFFRKLISSFYYGKGNIILGTIRKCCTFPNKLIANVL